MCSLIGVGSVRDQTRRGALGGLDGRLLRSSAAATAAAVGRGTGGPLPLDAGDTDPAHRRRLFPAPAAAAVAAAQEGVPAGHGVAHDDGDKLALLLLPLPFALERGNGLCLLFSAQPCPRPPPGRSVYQLCLCPSLSGDSGLAEQWLRQDVVVMAITTRPGTTIIRVIGGQGAELDDGGAAGVLVRLGGDVEAEAEPGAQVVVGGGGALALAAAAAEVVAQAAVGGVVVAPSAVGGAAQLVDAQGGGVVGAAVGDGLFQVAEGVAAEPLALLVREDGLVGFSRPEVVVVVVVVAAAAVVALSRPGDDDVGRVARVGADLDGAAARGVAHEEEPLRGAVVPARAALGRVEAHPLADYGLGLAGGAPDGEGHLEADRLLRLGAAVRRQGGGGGGGCPLVVVAGGGGGGG